jgi:hypothetical protein
MISAEDAKTRRIIGLIAQILQMFGSANAAALLKVFFNEHPLISAGKCSDSARPLQVEIG